MPTSVIAAGCEEKLSAIHPAGPAAEAIATLWWVLLSGATTISLFVLVLLVLAFRRRRGPDLPRAEPRAEARFERFWVHGLGLGFTLGTLSALTLYGIYIGERLLPRPGTEVVTVRAEGAQWTWRFTYADLPDRMTENVLHIPAARPVDVQITSADVVHSFWAPRLAGKLDAIPGHVNVLRLQADVPGDYAGVGTEFNGRGYTGHRFTVRAHDQAGWIAFVSGEPPPEPQGAAP